MALSANPLFNATSAHGDISSQKTFQNFNGSIVASTTFSYANAGNYIINNTANATTVNSVLANSGLTNFGYTAFVVSTNQQEVWGTRSSVPASGTPSGTTVFTKLAFLGNEQASSGNMSEP